jgi:LacI family transcriptional regulator
MRFEAVTIKDIAKALGLSTSTVSRALRDSYEISPETKKLVLDYALKINYHPNPIALGLNCSRDRQQFFQSDHRRGGKRGLYK